MTRSEYRRERPGVIHPIYGPKSHPLTFLAMQAKPKGAQFLSVKKTWKGLHGMM